MVETKRWNQKGKSDAFFLASQYCIAVIFVVFLITIIYHFNIFTLFCCVFLGGGHFPYKLFCYILNFITSSSCIIISPLLFFLRFCKDWTCNCSCTVWSRNIEVRKSSISYEMFIIVSECQIWVWLGWYCVLPGIIR